MLRVSDVVPIDRSVFVCAESRVNDEVSMVLVAEANVKALDARMCVISLDACVKVMCPATKSVTTWPMVLAPRP